jgi:predicted nucleic acid-binding protein
MTPVIWCGNQTVIEKRQTDDDTIAISFMSVAELFYGAEKSDHKMENVSLIEDFMFTVSRSGHI